MSHPLRAWNTFWFRPISARPLGAFRVAIGLLALANLAILAVDLDYWLTDAGLLTAAEARSVAGPLRPSLLFWVRDAIPVRLLFAATAIVATLFTLGWRTRAMAVLLYLATLSINYRCLPTNCGTDNLVLLSLFYLMLSPCGASYSLDALRAARRRGTLAEPLITPWAQRLVQLQLSLIYLNAAILKCRGTTWLGGTALHLTLNNPELDRFDVSFLSHYPTTLNLLSHGALFTEFALPLLLWFRATRFWAIGLGLALHGGILILINAPLFGELMIACYLPFLDPDELSLLLRPLNTLRLRVFPPSRAVVRGRVDPPESIHGPHVADLHPVEAGAEA